MHKTPVKVSLTANNRLSIYTDADKGLFSNGYSVVPSKHASGMWRFMLKPDKNGSSFKQRDNEDLRFQLVFGDEADHELPPQFNACEAWAFHSENGTIEVHLPEHLPRYKPRKMYKHRKGTDPVKVLERAIRDINRCRDEIEGLSIAFDEDGKLIAKVTITTVIGEGD